ncbi:hypothetical protein [Bacillus dakarensis]|uniref:hypothetical protein n=1 Tax=Robertmurraya dakarensis TaxID=1926278 RepID=UPI00098180FF|nr:hypothetical protein [Bacillus dakarensis]
MGSYFMVTDSDGIRVECIHYGYKKENAIRSIQKLKKGDIVKVRNQGKFICGIGWYILIVINNKEKMFVYIKNLENAMESNQLQSLLDLELEKYYLGFLVDNALDTRNRDLFMKVSHKYREIVPLMKNYNIYFSMPQ